MAKGGGRRVRPNGKKNKGKKKKKRTKGRKKICTPYSSVCFSKFINVEVTQKQRRVGTYPLAFKTATNTNQETELPLLESPRVPYKLSPFFLFSTTPHHTTPASSSVADADTKFLVDCCRRVAYASATIKKLYLRTAYRYCTYGIRYSLRQHLGKFKGGWRAGGCGCAGPGAGTSESKKRRFRRRRKALYIFSRQVRAVSTSFSFFRIYFFFIFQTSSPRRWIQWLVGRQVVQIVT